jgi:hypothetical protein
LLAAGIDRDGSQWTRALSGLRSIFVREGRLS